MGGGTVDAGVPQVTVSCGTLPSGHPYHRFGSGPERLVLMPGLMDSLGWNTPSRATAHLLAQYYFRPLREYEVWVVSRPPGLPVDATAASLGAGYVAALEEIGRSHVLGFSIGGILGAHLAAAAPALVDRLVIACGGERLGAYGREIVARWQSLAEDRRWTQLHLDYSRVVYAGWRRLVVPPLYRVGSPLLPTPVVPGDVGQSCEITLDCDGKRVLSAVDRPTLVVGGRDDPLYPTSVRQRTARRLAAGYLATVPGGHAVYDERRTQFCAAVDQFLQNE